MGRFRMPRIRLPWRRPVDPAAPVTVAESTWFRLDHYPKATAGQIALVWTPFDDDRILLRMEWRDAAELSEALDRASIEVQLARGSG